jgi:hypothetical protein
LVSTTGRRILLPEPGGESLAMLRYIILQNGVVVLRLSFAEVKEE